MPPYTRVRYIGYEVPTVTKVGPNRDDKAIYRIPADKYDITNPPELSGQVSKLSSDSKNRILRFIKVLQLARERVVNHGALSYGGADHNNTLKVFMAPEFYFRPDKEEKSYSLDEYRAISDVLTKTITANNDFNDWVIICGTIMYKRSMNLWADNKGGKVEIAYYNTCLCIYKQAEDKYSKEEVEKVMASAIDGIPTGRHGAGPVDDVKKSAPEMFKKFTTLEYQKKHIFTFKGVRCGLEICLEHAVFSYRHAFSQQLILINGNAVRYGILKNLMVNNNPVQLQFLPSGGMGIMGTSTVAHKAGRGYIMRNDGFDYSANNSAQMQNITGYSHWSYNPMPPGTWFVSMPNTAVPGTYMSVSNANAIPLTAYGLPQSCKIKKPEKASSAVWQNQPQRLLISSPRQL